MIWHSVTWKKNKKKWVTKILISQQTEQMLLPFIQSILRDALKQNEVNISPFVEEVKLSYFAPQWKCMSHNWVSFISFSCNVVNHYNCS